MSRSHRYRKLEKNLVSLILNRVGAFFVAIGKFFAAIFKFCDRKLTIMIVPHSQGKVINFQTNIFALILGVLMFIGISSSFVYFNHRNSGSAMEISRLREENRETLASLDELRDENNNLLQTAKRFQSSLSHSLSLLGISQSSSISGASQKNKDLSSLFDTQDVTSGTLKEAADIRQLNNYLESNVQPVEQIGKMLQSQENLFADIPNIWPIKGGIGHVSMMFGPNVHPKYNYWYIHKGMDFSTYRKGDPIIATANGQVVTVSFSQDFGNYVIIQHKYGIYTRYAHLDTVRVRKGQTVSQRDVIGTLGDSGLAVGAHLHYEVHIGSDVVDPEKYVNIK